MYAAVQTRGWRRRISDPVRHNDLECPRASNLTIAGSTRDFKISSAASLSAAAGQALRDELEGVRRANLRLTRQLVRLRQATVQARHLAGHDALTGLANRRLLFDRLDQAFIRAGRSHRQVVLLLLDLNGFKRVNDRLGHAVGDELLREVALRLSHGVRAGDTVCRYGGDEFVIALPDVESKAIAAVAHIVAQKVRARLEMPFVIGNEALTITASVGIAYCRGPNQSASELLRRADAAMYLAKSAPGGLATGSRIVAAST